MPRLAKTEMQKRMDNINAVIASCLINQHLEKGQFIKRCGFNEGTYFNRQKDPGKFKVEELYSMANVLNISIHTLLGKEE